MAITQKTYTERIGKAYNGQIANTHTCDADTYRVEDEDGIGWGVAVQRGTADDQIKVGATATKFLGITIKDPTQGETAGDKYTKGTHASVLYRGDLWVSPYEAVAAGDALVARQADGRLGKTVSATANEEAHKVSGGIWLDDAATGVLARVRLSGDIAG